VCRAGAHEQPRDAHAEAAMATREAQQDDGPPEFADATTDASETMQAPCPAADCDSNQASSETMPKPGGSYEVRLFTCVECGATWRAS
jgi:DNA-directed RNA polymerase subunit M